MNSKVSSEDLKNIIDEKVDANDYNNDISNISKKIEDINKELNKKCNTYVTIKEFESLQKLVNTKADINIMNEALNTKANKDTILSALQKKSNKDEVDAILSEKIDKSEYLNLVEEVNSKIGVDYIDKINNQLNEKSDKNVVDELIDKLNEKAEESDFKIINEAFQESKTNLTKKIDDIDQDLDRLIENIKNQFSSLNVVITNLHTNKIDFTTFDKLGLAVSKKVDNETFDSSINEFKNEIFKSISSLKSELSTNRKKFDDKMNEKIINFQNEIKNIISDINQQKNIFNQIISQKSKEKEEFLDTAKNIINTALNDNNNDIIELKNNMEALSTNNNNFISDLTKINEELSNKTNINDLEELLQKMTDNFLNKLNQLNNDLSTEINKKITINEVNALLTDKVSIEALNDKANISDIISINKMIETLQSNIINKVDTLKYESNIKKIKLNQDELQKQINTKSNLKDILSILKSKAEITDVNNALIDIHKELESKNSKEQFQNAMENQSIINDTLCSENYVGRWLWNSGKVKNGYAIPWEIQSVNTAPDNYIFEKDKTYIILKEGGLYHTVFGFYSDKKPVVQLLVNGDVIITSNSVLSSNNASGKLKNISKSSWGKIVGLTNSDYLLYPDNAKISISYSGDDGAIGFLSLKKI